MFNFISLAVLVFSIEADTNTVVCSTVPDEEYCAASYGCFWTNENDANEEYYCSDVLDLDDPYPDSYEVWATLSLCRDKCPVGSTFCDCYTLQYPIGGEIKYIQYPIGAIPDACNYAAAIWADFSCTEALFDNNIHCAVATIQNEEECYEDSSAYYGNLDNAGICSTPTTIQGCTALPFCDWNSSADSKCQPDFDCYYYWLNGNVGGCHSDSPYYCKTDTTTDSVTKDWCTADTITSERRACNALVNGKLTEADRSAACTGDCEYVAGGTTPSTYTTLPNTAYSGWCVPIGSGTSAVHVSSFVLAAVLTVMLAFL